MLFPGRFPNCQCGALLLPVDPNLSTFLLALWQQVYSDHDFPRVSVPHIELFIRRPLVSNALDVIMNCKGCHMMVELVPVEDFVVA